MICDVRQYDAAKFMWKRISDFFLKGVQLNCFLWSFFLILQNLILFLHSFGFVHEIFSETTVNIMHGKLQFWKYKVMIYISEKIYKWNRQFQIISMS